MYTHLEPIPIWSGCSFIDLNIPNGKGNIDLNTCKTTKFKEWSHGCKIRYICDKGFKLDGTSEVHCTDKGWNSLFNFSKIQSWEAIASCKYFFFQFGNYRKYYTIYTNYARANDNII